MSKQTTSIGRAVGILYILGTVFGILSVAVTSSISGSDDVLGAVASHEIELALGALLVLSSCVVCLGWNSVLLRRDLVEHGSGDGSLFHEA